MLTWHLSADTLNWEQKEKNCTFKNPTFAKLGKFLKECTAEVD